MVHYTSKFLSFVNFVLFVVILIPVFRITAESRLFLPVQVGGRKHCGRATALEICRKGKFQLTTSNRNRCIRGALALRPGSELRPLLTKLIESSFCQILGTHNYFDLHAGIESKKPGLSQ